MTDILNAVTKSKNDRIYKIASDMAALVATKNKAYNDSTRKTEAILEMLFPGGVPKEKMIDLVYIIPLINKICRISGNKDAFDENPYLDIIGYGLLAAERFNKIYDE